MATFTETLSLVIDAKTGGAVRDVQAFGRTVGKTGDDMTATATKGGFLDRQLKNLGLTGVNSGTLIATGAAIGGAALGKLAREAIETNLRYTGLARDFQRASGTNAESASRMVAVFDDLEISQGAAAKGFFKLAREVGANGAVFDEFGFKVAKTKDGSLDIEETMLRVAEAYATSTDQAERARLVQVAFGRGGQELLPILEKGRAGIERLFANVDKGQIFTQEDLDQARAYELAIDNLKDSLDEVQIQLGQALTPALTDAANALATVVRGTNELQQAAGIDIFKAVTDSALRSVPVFGSVYGITKDVGHIFGIGGSKADEFTEAQQRVADASKAVADEADNEVVNSKNLAAAQRELTSAKGALEGVQQKVVKALTDENSKMQEQLNLSVQRLGGITAVVAADQARSNAIDKRFAAEAALAKLEAEGKAGTLEYAAAQRDLAAAHVGVVQAQVNVQNSVSKLQKDLNDGTISQAKYNQEIAALKAQNPAVAASIDAVTKEFEAQAVGINNVPTSHHTEMTAADGVTGVANSAKWSIGQVPFFHHTDFTASDYVTGVVNGIRNSIAGAAAAVINFNSISRQHGGPIPGGVNDAVPVMAHGGEYVLSADVVERIKSGRPSRGAAVSGGTLGAPSGGGGSPTFVTAQLIVDGQKWAEQMIGVVNNRARSGPVFDSSAVRN